MECIERTLQVCKNHKVIFSNEQVLQDEHARNIKHGEFLVQYQGPFGSNCKGQWCHQGWKCSTNSTKCPT